MEKQQKRGNALPRRVAFRRIFAHAKSFHPPSPIGHVNYTRGTPATSTRVQQTPLAHGERMDVVPIAVETNNLCRSYMVVNVIVRYGLIAALTTSKSMVGYSELPCIYGETPNADGKEVFSSRLFREFVAFPQILDFSPPLKAEVVAVIFAAFAAQSFLGFQAQFPPHQLDS
jgi:hypothetical protein